MPRLTHIGALSVSSPTEARKRILRAIDTSNGNRRDAAATLGISVRQLFRLVTQLGAWRDVDAAAYRNGTDYRSRPTLRTA